MAVEHLLCDPRWPVVKSAAMEQPWPDADTMKSVFADINAADIEHLREVLKEGDIDVVDSTADARCSLVPMTLKMAINRRYRRPLLILNSQFTFFSYTYGTIAWLASFLMYQKPKVSQAQLILKDYDSSTDSNLQNIIAKLPNLVDLHLFLVPAVSVGVSSTPDLAHLGKNIAQLTQLRLLRLDIPAALQTEKSVIGILNQLQELKVLSSLHLGLQCNHHITDNMVEAMQPILHPNLQELSVDFSSPTVWAYGVRLHGWAKLLVLIAESRIVSLSLSLRRQMDVGFVGSLIDGLQKFRQIRRGSNHTKQVFIDVSGNPLCQHMIYALASCLFCAGTNCYQASTTLHAWDTTPTSVCECPNAASVNPIVLNGENTYETIGQALMCCECALLI